MIKKRKTLQELTITDEFLFGAVMTDQENCRQLLEMILEIPIEKVEVVQEKSLIYHPEYKGVRLDVFAKDEKGTKFDVEMQVRKTPIEKRSRYYHSQMDMEMLHTGISYEELLDVYVIFICCYDPFSRDKYRYTFGSYCNECPDLEMDDGIHTIILNNTGNNPEDVPLELVRFLEFTKRSLAESEEDSEDPFIQRLQKSIRDIKKSREMGERYMTLEEMLKEERKEGIEEGIEKGRAQEIFASVQHGDYDIRRGMEKMNITNEKVFRKSAKAMGFIIP